MKISIIIPVFNEKNSIEEIMKRVLQASTLGYEKEITIVDDGSNDGTEEILENLKRKYNFTLVRHSRKMGKGAAIKTALEKITGDVVLIQDADLEYDPNDYPALLSAFNHNHSVIYGSRNLNISKRGYYLYFLGGEFITVFFNIMFGSKLTDVNTGYKLFRTDIIKSIDLRSYGFEFCVEVTARILKLGYAIKELPIHYNPRKFSEGKKLRFWNGFSIIWTIIKVLKNNY